MQIQLASFYDDKDFQYVTSDLPLAFLYIEKDNWDWYSKYTSFKNPEKWLKIFHQTAGYMCHHEFFYAYHLPWKNAEVELAFRKFCDSQFESCMGGNFPLDTAIQYRETVKQAFNGVLDINYCYNKTQEGFYPFDLTKSALEYITSENILTFDSASGLPNAFDLVTSNDPPPNPEPEIGLVILGENCD